MDFFFKHFWKFLMLWLAIILGVGGTFAYFLFQILLKLADRI